MFNYYKLTCITSYCRSSDCIKFHVLFSILSNYSPIISCDVQYIYVTSNHIKFSCISFSCICINEIVYSRINFICRMSRRVCNYVLVQIVSYGHKFKYIELCYTPLYNLVFNQSSLNEIAPYEDE